MKEKTFSGPTLGDMGDVGDFFGLDEFGDPVDNPMIGALAGGAVATAATLGIKKMATAGSSLQRYAEAWGAVAGVGVGAAMWLMGRKAGGATAAAVALSTNGLRALYQQLFPTLSGPWGEVAIENREALHGTLGLVAPENRTGLQGARGLGDRMPALLGRENAAKMTQILGTGLPLSGDNGLGQNSAARMTQILGGPPVSGLGSLYGATLFTR